MARFFYFAGGAFFVITGLLPVFLRLSAQSPLGTDMYTVLVIAAQGLLAALIPGLLLIGLGALLFRLDRIIENTQRSGEAIDASGDALR